MFRKTTEGETYKSYIKLKYRFLKHHYILLIKNLNK